eukprot:Hpha_TRINITY_DN14387_c0_g1::TRINITY_DN14387_c0_g1_i1::g.86552::m.86552
MADGSNEANEEEEKDDMQIRLSICGAPDADEEAGLISGANGKSGKNVRRPLESPDMSGRRQSRKNPLTTPGRRGTAPATPTDCTSLETPAETGETYETTCQDSGSDEEDEEEFEEEEEWVTAAELTAEEEKGLQRFFNRLDRTMDGSLQKSELNSACSLLDLRLSKEQVDSLQDAAGCREKDSIQADEFLRFMAIVKTVVPSQTWTTASGRKLNWVVTKVLRDRDQHDVMQVHRRRELIESTTARPLTSWLARAVIESTRQLVALYWGLTVPLFFALPGYHYDRVGGVAMLVCECMCTTVGLLDFVAQVVHGFEISSFKTWADFCATQPLDLIGYAAGVKPLHRFGYVLRVMALVKLLRFDQFRPGLGGRLVTIRSVQLGLYVLPVIKESILSMLLVHIVACTFRALTCTDTCDDVMGGEEYVISLYWALYTISSVGYGDVAVNTTGGRIFAILVFIAAILVNGWLIGKLASYMMLDPASEHRQMLARTMQVITSYHLPEDVIEDVLSLQNHLLEQKLVLRSFLEVVNTLPPEVQEVLSLYVRVEFLGQIPLFAEASAACKVSLAEGLCKRTVSRGEDIIVEDEVGYCMYVIVHGFAEVYKKDVSLATLTKGAAFGEMALLSEENVRAASVRSLALCEILSLARSDFDNISGRFPTLRWQIEVIIAKRKGVSPPSLEAVLAQCRNRKVSVDDGSAGGLGLETNEEVDAAIDSHLLKKHVVKQGMADDLESKDGSSTPRAHPSPWESLRMRLGVRAPELRPERRPSLKHSASIDQMQMSQTRGSQSKRRRSSTHRRSSAMATAAAGIGGAAQSLSRHGSMKSLTGGRPRSRRPSDQQPIPPPSTGTTANILMQVASRLHPAARNVALGLPPPLDGSPQRSASPGPSRNEIMEKLNLVTMQNESLHSRIGDVMKQIHRVHRSLTTRIISLEETRKTGGATIGFSRRDILGERRENERGRRNKSLAETSPGGDVPMVPHAMKLNKAYRQQARGSAGDIFGAEPGGDVPNETPKSRSRTRAPSDDHCST